MSEAGTLSTMVPPVPVTIAEKIGSIESNATGSVPAESALRDDERTHDDAARIHAVAEGRFGKPAGMLLATVRSTVSPDVTGLCAPVTVIVPA